MKRAILWMVLLLSLTGCGSGKLPQAREMGDMALLRTMGVDLGRDGFLSVTVSTGGEDAVVLSAEQPSLSAACLAMQGQSDRYVFYGYVDQLLLGEELSKQGVLEVLHYFAQDVELGLNSRTWVIRSAAGEAMEERETDSRLETLGADSRMGIALATRTAGEFLSGLLEEGSAYVPALDRNLQEAGYAVFRGDQLKGYLDRELSRGLELLTGSVTADVLQFEIGGSKVVVRLSGTKSRVTPYDGDRAVKIECRIQANIAESGRELEQAELDELCRRLEEREQERIRRTLAQLQEWNADCVGIGRKMGMKNPSGWAQLRENWDSVFPNLSAEVQVHAKIEGGVL